MVKSGLQPVSLRLRTLATTIGPVSFRTLRRDFENGRPIIHIDQGRSNVGTIGRPGWIEVLLVPLMGQGMKWCYQLPIWVRYSPQPKKLLATKRLVFVPKGQNPEKKILTTKHPTFVPKAKQFWYQLKGKRFVPKFRPTLSSRFKVTYANSGSLGLESEPQRTLEMRDARSLHASNAEFCARLTQKRRYFATHTDRPIITTA